MTRSVFCMRLLVLPLSDIPNTRIDSLVDVVLFQNLTVNRMGKIMYVLYSESQ